MNIFLGIIIGILALAVLVTAHEFGHFIMARKNGVKVNEFGIGFPPRAIAWLKGKDGKWHKIPKSEWSKKQSSLILSLNWLPIGGFCAMEGESDADTKKGSFGASSFWVKTKILFGGVLMNWLIAIIIFTLLAWFGMPQILPDQFEITSDATITSTAPVVVDKIIENSPAAAAGFAVGDRIISINDQPVIVASDVSNINQTLAEQIVTYHISRDDNTELDLLATLNSADSAYLLGVSMSSGQTFVRSTWSAPIVGVVTTFQLTGETFRGLGDLIGNFVSGVARQLSPDATTREEGQQALELVGDSVSGPVGIVGYLFPNMINYGPGNLFFLIALISVSLACMNVIPIPALDGGRWLLIAIFRLRGKKLEKATEEKIVSRAMYILLALVFIITILDIIRFF